ncbi:MAG: hypothetical protein HY746_06290 [Elusimicrobia bacterium]|nr:hypothetical protein [Elusimicrobiota bacterium]
MYFILIKDPLPERKILIEVIEKIYSFTPEKAAEYIRENPGFLPECLSLEKAREISGKALNYSIETAVIEEHALAKPPEPGKFEKAGIKPEGMVYFLSPDKKMFLHFEKIFLIAAGITSEDILIKPLEEMQKEAQDRLRENFGSSEQTKPSKPLVPRAFIFFNALFKNLFYRIFPEPPSQILRGKELCFYADIFSRVPPHRLRMKHDEFDYSLLGKTKSYSTIENFRTFLKELDRISLKAVKNETFRAIINDRNLSVHKHGSLSAYEEEIIRLLTFFPCKS